MDTWRTRLEEVLHSFDQRTDAFADHRVRAPLDALAQEARNNGQVPFELGAELAAFNVFETHSSPDSKWGNYYGPIFSDQSIEDLTPEVFAYWSRRAVEARHPLLKFRYANLVWDLAPKVKGFRREVGHARILIDAAIQVAERRASEHISDIYRKLERAHDVAVGIKDGTLVEAVRGALVRFEGKAAEDHRPGTWGYSFELLVAGDNKKFPVLDDLRSQLIVDMEARLARLSGVNATSGPNPRAAEEAALALANHYRRRQQPEEMKRVLGTYAAAHVQAASDVNGLEAAGLLQKVVQTLSSFGLNEEAERVAVCYQEHAQRSRENMHTFSTEFSITQDEIDVFLREQTEGDLPEVLRRFARHHLPRRAETERQVRELAEEFVLSHSITQEIQDEDGRAVATVGPVDEDLEGQLALRLSQNMQIGAVFLRMVLEHLTKTRDLNADHVTVYLSGSPIFDPDRQPILAAGLRAYFAEDWLTAIHLLVPQIEQGVRLLVRRSGGNVLKPGRNGAMMLKTLDELLRDERVERAVRADGAFYLRTLLTDQRGWNIRNAVCHGMMSANHFDSRTADRVLHALLFLGLLESRPRANPEPQPEVPADSPTGPA